MERFAKIKKAGKKRKLDVKAICRCCGIENDEKEEIFNQFSDDGVDFSDKVAVLTGIKATRADKMPQSMCVMCIDKINDFYEFRLMAQNTETQTREALGLPSFTEQLAQTKALPLIETKPSVVRLTDLKYQTEDSLLIERVLSGKSDTIPSTSARTSNKRPPPSSVQAKVVQPPSKKSKKEVSCNICNDTHFEYQNDLNDHLMKEHLPLVAKYACGSCRETFEQLSEIKAHETWHTREKIPYTCYICSSDYLRPRDFSKHMTNFNCKEKEKLVVTTDDIKCFQCKKKFLTQNLFEWHPCFLKSRGSCNKCGKYFYKKKLLFTHYVLCEGEFEAPETAKDPARTVKAENSKKTATIKVSDANPKVIKGPKKKIVPPRKISTMPNIVKKEINLGPLTGEPEDDDDEYAHYEEDITYDNFGNDSDSNDARSAALQPVVELQEKPTIRIKQERVNDVPVIQQKPTSNALTTAQLIRNIKKEKGAAPVITTSTNPQAQQQNNTWKLKIKAERGITKSTAQVLNPMAVGAIKSSQGVPKSLKIPQALAMKIKMEKKDAGYGDVVEQRDEAEPEDEDLMGENSLDQPVIRIKKEKIDPAYGDVYNVTKKKQLINPMALMMRDKSTTNGSLEKSLVISAVTSINPILPEGGEVMSQTTVETSFTLGTPETNDVTEPGKALENMAMEQIPRELSENQENNSSTSAPLEEMSGTSGESCANENHIEKQCAPMNKDDDLDALLKIYEDAPSAPDSNDLFQELLKFD